MSNFILNEIFEKKAKVYQTRPVRAMVYEKGMETGFIVYFANQLNAGSRVLHEGMKFFDTESEAWDYINSNPKQYIKKDNELVEIKGIMYEAPLPILHRKVNSPDERVGFISCHEGKYAFVSNESEQYDFFYLDSNTGDKPTWIIQEADGRVRVWDVDFPECCEETFFGKEDEFIYEKVAENEYVQVTM